VDTDQGEAPAPWWQCIVAALPNLFLSFQFVMAALAGKALFATPEWLTAVMQVEMFVIHSMGIVGAFLFYKPASAWRALGRVLILIGLFALYLFVAYTMGFDRVVVFVSAAFATYFGVIFSWGSRTAIDQLGTRWIVCAVVWWAAVNAFDLPKEVKDWAGLGATLWAGALYFLALGAIELSGFYLRTVPRKAHRWHPSMRRG
jgi:hypothetical protein